MYRQPLVLVVEQDLHYLELLNSHFKLLKLSCICAKQGIKALILSQTHQPDLILLDIALPDLNGLQVIHYLKRNPETTMIPIIGVTVLTSEQDGDSILLAGADDCITKPYNFPQLEAAIHCHLNRVHSYN
ncbi:response regulator [Mastigocladopsis repens]|uniref:response regulator n=1 Tax=Mastigocladopsis repens TaxID=221287 RepID=UPI0002FAE685|nr:response regulator [Mastigocladopsis repens]